MIEQVPFSNQILTSKAHIVMGKALPDVALVDLIIIREDRAFMPVLLTLAEADEVIAMLTRVRECAARGHDATPERTPDGLRFSCRRCGAQWGELT